MKMVVRKSLTLIFLTIENGVKRSNTNKYVWLKPKFWLK